MQGTIDIAIACHLHTPSLDALTKVADEADCTISHPLIAGSQLIDTHHGSSQLVFRLYLEMDQDAEGVQTVVDECVHHVRHNNVRDSEIINII